TRELGDWTWGQAAVHLAGHPARRFGLAGRGLLRDGYVADIAMVDPARVADRADYAHPRRPAHRRDARPGAAPRAGRLMSTPEPAAAEPDAQAGPLVTLGETMGVLIPAAAGPLHRGAGLRLSIAGSESNVAIGVRRLGVAATWIGRVGPDEVGDLILRELRAEDVAVRAVRDRAPTGLMLKTTRAAGITRVSYFRAA